MCVTTNLFGQSIKQKKAEEFLRLSGLKEYTLQIDEIALAKSDEELLFLDDSQSNLEIKAIIKLYLNHDNINHHIKEYLAHKVDESLLNHANLFLENPINEDIQGTRTRTLSRFEKIDKAKYVNSFDMENVDQDRFDICVNIYQLLKIGKITESILHQTTLNVSMGFNEHKSTDKKTEEEIKNEIDMMFSDQYRQVMMTNQIANMMYIFSGISNTTLNSYINKWHTYDGEKTLILMDEAINYSFIEVMKEIKNHGS